MNATISVREGASKISVEATPTTWATAVGAIVLAGIFFGALLTNKK